MKFPLPAAALLLAQAVAIAQAPPPAAGNLIRNGGFENTLPTPNIWTGVDKDGFLAGFRGYLPALNEAGQIADTPMPLSVAVADLNGDGLPDILTADPLGYVRSYLNSGSKEQPKFTSGSATTPFLSVTDGSTAPSLPGLNEGINWRDPEKRNAFWSQRKMGVRASLSPLGDGRYALVAGNYCGDIFFLAQGSGAGLAAFPQPEPLEKAVLSLSKSPDSRWGNIFAPLLHDWDGDGKADLLVGEGSYSANNIHFFPNTGSTAAPAFSLENRSILALGQGREQLTPAVADVNGDGKADLLVSDSRGRITAYLRPPSWKKGDSMSPSGYLAKTGGLTDPEDKNNQAIVLGAGIHTVAAGDLNGDSLFDLVAGKPSGRVAWSPNKGSKEQPKFDQWTEITGDKPVPAVWMLPSQWDLDTGDKRANFFAYANCVSAQEDPSVDAKEGTRALKFGFSPTPDSPLAGLNFPGNRSFRFGEYNQKYYFYELPPASRLLGAPNRTFMMQQQLRLEAGKPYTLSFQHRGSGVVRANIFVGWWGFKVLGADTVTRGTRGATQIRHNHANEHDKISKDFRPGAAWTTFSEKITINFKNRDLKDQTTTHAAILIIVFELSSPDGVLYLDDLKLVPSA